MADLQIQSYIGVFRTPAADTFDEQLIEDAKKEVKDYADTPNRVSVPSPNNVNVQLIMET